MANEEHLKILKQGVECSPIVAGRLFEYTWEKEEERDV